PPWAPPTRPGSPPASGTTPTSCARTGRSRSAGNRSGARNSARRATRAGRRPSSAPWTGSRSPDGAGGRTRGDLRRHARDGADGSAIRDVLAQAVGELPPRQREPVALDEGVDGGSPATDGDGRARRVGGAGQSRHGDQQRPQSLS